jgi:hypothetical protein
MPIKIQSGGGITSNKLVRPGIRASERGSKGINPGRVSQVGTTLGTHAQEAGSRKLNPVTPAYTQAPNFAPKFGNEVALNVGKGGPGTGRTVRASGTQGMHGAPVRENPPPDGELFPGFPGRRS